MPNASRKNLLELCPSREGRSNTAPEHAGLLLDRYLVEHTNENSGIRALQDSAVGIPASPVYKEAFRRWKAAMESLGYLLIPGELASALAIGMGGESVSEVGITLQHTYGVPYIPGTGIKGLCHSVALESTQIRDGQSESDLSLEAVTYLFGSTEVAGTCVFADAWYDPDSVAGKPLTRDTITVHHQKYYGSHGRQEVPSDFDDPNPVSFVSVRAKTRFLFAIRPPEGWGEYVAGMLKWALDHRGIGGKKNAGYGYFAFGTSLSGSGDSVGSPQESAQQGQSTKRGTESIAKSDGKSDNKSDQKSDEKSETKVASPLLSLPERFTVQNVTLKLVNPSSGELHIECLVGGISLRAVAIADRSQEIRRGLSDALKEQLKKKKQLVCKSAEIQRKGERFEILSVLA